MQELQREKVGNFDLSQAIELEDLEKNGEDFIKQYLISIPEFFKEYKCIYLENEQLKLLINGVKIKTDQQDDGLYQIKTKDETWIGVGIVQNKLLKRKLIINS